MHRCQGSILQEKFIIQFVCFFFFFERYQNLLQILISCKKKNIQILVARLLTSIREKMMESSPVCVCVCRSEWVSMFKMTVATILWLKYFTKSEDFVILTEKIVFLYIVITPIFEFVSVYWLKPYWEKVWKSVKRFLLLQKKNPKEIHECLLKYRATNAHQSPLWKSDVPIPSVEILRPNMQKNLGCLQWCPEIILVDQQILAKNCWEEISIQCINFRIHEQLDMQDV